MITHDGGYSSLTVCLVLSSAMFAGSYAAGMLPLWLGRNISARRANLVAAFGTGLLLGASLGIVLPEGVGAVVRAAAAAAAGAGDDDHDDGDDHDDDHHGDHGHGHVHGGGAHVEGTIGWSLLFGFMLMFLVDNCAGGLHGHGHGGGGGHGHAHGGKRYEAVGTGGGGRRLKLRTSGHEDRSDDELLEGGGGDSDRSGGGGGGGGSGSSGGGGGGGGGPLGDMGSAPPPGAALQRPPPSPRTARKRGRTALLGLLVHAAADGFALGAAGASRSANLELVVFVAIMLHKGPAAFGLAAYLVRERVPRGAVRRSLALFSLAAPVAAVATLLALDPRYLGGKALVGETAVGVSLLVSGGTFLYVAAVHVLPEMKRDGGALEPRELAAVVVGALFPLVVSIHHEH